MSSLTQFARTRAADRAAIVNQQRECLLTDTAEDTVHDFRVALRRMEQIFELFDSEPLAFDIHQAQQQMNDWMRAAGRVRDCDVAMPLMPAPWTNDLLAMRRDRAAELVQILSAGPAMPAPAMKRLRSPSFSEEVARFARMTLPREAKAYFQAGARAARKKHSIGRLHEFRLHGKSLRYSLELFQPLYGCRVRDIQKMLKRTQQLLGEMADARAGLKLAKLMNAPDRILEPLRLLAHEKRDAFAGRWLKEVPDEAAAARWVEYLRRYATVR